LPCPVVSVGATPTAMFARSLEGVTEMRPGVYTLMDLYQMAIGVCRRENIAASVLATVISHNPRTNRILVDAGALALSQDKGAAGIMQHVGFGWVCAEKGERLDGLYVAEVNQEHGMIAAASGPPPFERLPVGARVRILPNHACMMAAPYARYNVVEGGDAIVAVWDKASGW
jgi:D-serine deaminase-like pyridoxal phosphate-dependent protein